MHSVKHSIVFLLALAAMLSSAVAGPPAHTPPEAAQLKCDQGRLQSIPARAATASGGHEFARRLEALSVPARDALIRAQLLAGNIPDFLRHLVPVSIPDGGVTPSRVQLTACVLPDYLAIGSDGDFVFVPMGLAAALEVAAGFGFTLPTPDLVDAIYRASAVKLAPLPLPASDEMRSTAYFIWHNDLIAQQRDTLRAAIGELTAGHKKDLVLSSRLWSLPGRVAIYGWHRGPDEPIQPLSTRHGARYADYSHGVRLVSNTAYVNGMPRAMMEVLEDSALASRLTDEGPWTQVAKRLAALIGHEDAPSSM